MTPFALTSRETKALLVYFIQGNKNQKSPCVKKLEDRSEPDSSTQTPQR